MKISELIERLEEHKKVIGDVEVRGLKFLLGDVDNYPFKRIEVGLDIDANKVIEIS